MKIGNKANTSTMLTITKPPIPPVINTTPLSADRQYLPRRLNPSEIPFFLNVITLAMTTPPYYGL